MLNPGSAGKIISSRFWILKKNNTHVIVSTVSTGSVPFLIYDESQQKPAVSAVPFKVFEDQENCCPADVIKPPKRRSLSGILQPSLEVQSDPTEEKDCIVMEEPIANVEPVTNVSSLGQTSR